MMLDSGYAQNVTSVPDGALDALDHEIDQLAQRIDTLAARIGPVRSMYATAVADSRSEPRPEPGTALRGRIERLRDLRAMLEQITSEIDL